MTTPQDRALSPTGWRDLVRINNWINETIKPLTDLQHWGVIERWSYPDDGYGDCEDYALLKRRMLIEAGWPREALLLTLVRGADGEGHAMAVVILASPKTCGQSAKARLVVISSDVFSYSLLIRWNSNWPPGWLNGR
jgi:predicted transglutaminase-like cysteine proteinase